MIDPKEQAAADQSNARIVEFMPPLLWSLFREFAGQGVQTYLLALVQGRPKHAP